MPIGSLGTRIFVLHILIEPLKYQGKINVILLYHCSINIQNNTTNIRKKNAINRQSLLQAKPEVMQCWWYGVQRNVNTLPEPVI